MISARYSMNNNHNSFRGPYKEVSYPKDNDLKLLEVHVRLCYALFNELYLNIL